MAQFANRVGLIAPCTDVLMQILLLRTPAYWLLAAVSFLGGCTAWRGELPPTHVRSVEKQVRDIGLTDLGSHSGQIPRTVEDDLDSVRQRRAPKPEALVPKPEASAPNVLALSVGDLRLKTLRNNLNLNVVFVEPEIARTMISEEEAKFDTTFFGGARYTRQDLPKLDRDLVELTSDNEELDGAKVKLTQIAQTKDAVEFDFGIKIPLPTGDNIVVQNLFNEARKSQLRRALLSRAQRLATRAQRELGIRQEVYDTLDILDQNWQRILAARQNVIVTGVNYDAELKQFEEGLRTMREVLEALTQLGDAQIRELQAIIAYQAAQIDLAFATGTLLGYAGVGLGPVPLGN